MSHSVLTACALGPTPYGEGLRMQDALVQARAAGETGDWLLFPDHPSVLTIGRNPSPDSLIADRGSLERAGIEVVEVTRGGDITWHGPGQLVGYPVVALDRVGRDLHRWLRTLEEGLIEAMARYGLACTTVPGRTGVWLDESRKLASIGVAVRRWVGYHGFALNVAPDLAAFDLIHPCGLRGIRMTSMREALGPGAPDLPAVRSAVTEVLAARLGYDDVRWAGPEEVRRLSRTAGPVSSSNPTGPTRPEPQFGGMSTW